jgi:hypothetical protein
MLLLIVEMPVARVSRGTGFSAQAARGVFSLLTEARVLGDAMIRLWAVLAMTLALTDPWRGLLVAAAYASSSLVEWRARRPRLDAFRYCAIRSLEDVSYSLGVWRGCLKSLNFRPLLPRLASPLFGNRRGRGMGA